MGAQSRSTGAPSASTTLAATPITAVVMGSDIGRYVAKVISWDFEVDDDDPIVTMELVPLSPEALTEALYRNRPSAA